MKIEEARKNLEQAQLGMIEVYLEIINNSYKNLSDVKRGEVVQGLERVACLINTPPVHKGTKGVILNPFNKLEARVTRIKTELTQNQVAERLGISQGCLAKYESGIVIPHPYRKGNGRKYLEFLKQNGYNPYNI